MALSLSEVLAKFPRNVLTRYDFSRTQYHGALERMTNVICHEHGPFTQYPAQFRKNGSGCPACGGEVRASKKRSTLETVVAQARAKHDDFYSYSNARYVNNQTKFAVTCPNHGDFLIAPNNHISGGKGCPDCGALKRGYRKDLSAAAIKTAASKVTSFGKKFEADARAVHGNAYDYSQVRYEGRKTKITILCPQHGPFTQSPEHHLKRAQGCPECSHPGNRLFGEVQSSYRSSL